MKSAYEVGSRCRSANKQDLIMYILHHCLLFESCLYGLGNFPIRHRHPDSIWAWCGKPDLGSALSHRAVFMHLLSARYPSRVDEVSRRIHPHVLCFRGDAGTLAWWSMAGWPALLCLFSQPFLFRRWGRSFLLGFQFSPESGNSFAIGGVSCLSPKAYLHTNNIFQ